MQLVIVDIQNTYRKWCQPLIEKIPQLSVNYSEVFYLFDNVSGQSLSEELPEEWAEFESFCEQLNVIEKQYGFLRGLMDSRSNIEDDEVIRLGKFLIKNQLTDAREIEENPDLEKKYLNEFKNSPLLNINFHDYSFGIPDDLVLAITNSIRPGVTLVGGGRNECLKEIQLLLKILDIPHATLTEYTY